MASEQCGRVEADIEINAVNFAVSDNGTTASTDFPTTTGGFDTVHDGGFDVFVATVSADGSALVWSTFLGGAADEQARGIAFDAAGRPLVCASKCRKVTFCVAVASASCKPG